VFGPGRECGGVAVSFYLSGDEVEQCRLALRQGVQLVVLASRLRISGEDLARLLGVPADQTRGRDADADAALDLWAGERLQGVL